MDQVVQSGSSHLRPKERPCEVTQRYLRGQRPSLVPRARGQQNLRSGSQGSLRSKSAVCLTQHNRLFIMMPYLY